MIFYYLDASAWVKRYAQETGSRWMEELFAQEPRLACASLGVVEVMATLARKHKAKQLADADFEEQSENVIDDWDDLAQIHLTPEALLFARESAYRMALRGADAIHLGSALLFRQRFTVPGDEVILVASDRELKAAAQASGLSVLDPAEEEQSNLPSNE